MQIQGELQKKNCSLISIELQNTLVLLLLQKYVFLLKWNV